MRKEREDGKFPFVKNPIVALRGDSPIIWRSKVGSRRSASPADKVYSSEWFASSHIPFLQISLRPFMKAEFAETSTFRLSGGRR